MKIYRNPEVSSCSAAKSGCRCGCGNTCGCGCGTCGCVGCGTCGCGNTCGCSRDKCWCEDPFTYVDGYEHCRENGCWDACYDEYGRCRKCYNYCGIGFATRKVLDVICARSSGCHCQGSGLCDRTIADLCRERELRVSLERSARDTAEGTSPCGERCPGRSLAGSPLCGDNCGSQIGLAIEGCADCLVRGLEKPETDPDCPERTLPIGLGLGDYILEYGGDTLPFSLKRNLNYYYIDAEPRDDIEIADPDISCPMIHIIKIKPQSV